MSVLAHSGDRVACGIGRCVPIISHQIRYQTCRHLDAMNEPLFCCLQLIYFTQHEIVLGIARHDTNYSITEAQIEVGAVKYLIPSI